MCKRKLYLLSLFIFTGITFAYAQQNPYTLWYTHPAGNWNEALPIGNGRLGAMVFGGPAQGKLQLNEETVWAGSPNNNVNPEVRKVIPKLRRLLFEKKFVEAQKLANEKMVSPNNGMPYQPVGNLLLQFPGHENFRHYKRTLDISKAITTISYEVKGVHYKREIFASFPDQVIVIHLTADKSGKVTCQLKMNSPQKHKITTKNKKLILSGITGSHEGVPGKMRFNTQIKVDASGGKVNVTDSSLKIIGADEATIFVSIGTNFKNYHDLGGNPKARAVRYLNAGMEKNFQQLKQDQIAAYKKYFDRVKLDIGTREAANKPTDVRIAHFASGSDPQLIALYFQFGRYLLICSSQPEGQPPTLQGIWNNKMLPSWDSKYTININLEMNYWPVEITNLSELIEPLTQLVEDLSVTGRKSAGEMYGARGWMLHHNTDIWRITGQVDRAISGLWPSGGAWLCQLLWKHYLFTGDSNYLKRIYPLIKGAATYFVDALQEDQENHWLVVSPSISPENSYLRKDDISVSITAGCTMDNQLVFDLFSEVITASERLGKSSFFADTLRNMRDRLAPMQIGQYNQLQEWMYDWDDTSDHHRHVSHLYGLYPGNQISPYHSPKLFLAARNSLLYRGDVSTGWSMGWKINLWARLLNGNHALKLIKDQLRPAVASDGHARGGTYSNMFDAHPPFQIDGNFGFTAGVAEMLLQSHDGFIFVLPALPDEWRNGSVEGLLARGGFDIDMEWEEGKVSKVRIYSKLGGNCRIRSYQPLKFIDKWELKKGEGKNPNPFYITPNIKSPLISKKSNLKKISLIKTYLYDFMTKAGEEYILVAD